MAFSRWSQSFHDGANLPVIGATEAELKGIRVPACIVPGNDQTHPRSVGENAARLIPGSELHVLIKTVHTDMDISPAEEHARVYVDFMRKHASISG